MVVIVGAAVKDAAVKYKRKATGAPLWSDKLVARKIQTASPGSRWTVAHARVEESTKDGHQEDKHGRQSENYHNRNLRLKH